MGIHRVPVQHCTSKRIDYYSATKARSRRRDIRVGGGVCNRYRRVIKVSNVAGGWKGRENRDRSTNSSCTAVIAVKTIANKKGGGEEKTVCVLTSTLVWWYSKVVETMQWWKIVSHLL